MRSPEVAPHRLVPFAWAVSWWRLWQHWNASWRLPQGKGIKSVESRKQSSSWQRWWRECFIGMDLAVLAYNCRICQFVGLCLCGTLRIHILTGWQGGFVLIHGPRIVHFLFRSIGLPRLGPCPVELCFVEWCLECRGAIGGGMDALGQHLPLWRRIWRGALVVKHRTLCAGECSTHRDCVLCREPICFERLAAGLVRRITRGMVESVPRGVAAATSSKVLGALSSKSWWDYRRKDDDRAPQRSLQYTST